jgi:hypothetical protein
MLRREPGKDFVVVVCDTRPKMLAFRLHEVSYETDPHGVRCNVTGVDLVRLRHTPQADRISEGDRSRSEAVGDHHKRVRRSQKYRGRRGIHQKRNKHSWLWLAAVTTATSPDCARATSATPSIANRPRPPGDGDLTALARVRSWSVMRSTPRPASAPSPRTSKSISTSSERRSAAAPTYRV